MDEQNSTKTIDYNSIYDENDNILTEEPDLTLGYIKMDTITVHHDAVEEVKEEFHYETIAEYPNGGKDVKKVIDVEGVKARDAWDEEKDIQRYIKYTPEELSQKVERYKDFRINESKESLSAYLASHPLFWSDGKYYSVTSEKQSLLTSNLALYQISAAAGMPFKLTWNSTGDECVEWTYENLAALALGIGTYVKPFVSHQQELELAIKACTTMEEVDAIAITYETPEEPTDTIEPTEETTDGDAA